MPEAAPFFDANAAAMTGTRKPQGMSRDLFLQTGRFLWLSVAQAAWLSAEIRVGAVGLTGLG
jgi:hypothetical protein